MAYREFKQVVKTADTHLAQSYWELPGVLLSHRYKDGIVAGSNSFHNDAERVRIHFNLDGGYDFHYHQLKTTYRLTGRRHNLMYSPDFTMDVHSRSSHVETFGIQFDKDTFLQFAGGGNDALKRMAESVDLGKAFMASSSWGGEDPLLFGALHDIRSCGMESEMKRLLVESKVVEILDRQTTCLNSLNLTASLSRKERSQMYAARDFVMANLQQPPALKAVAQAAGTNEFKLKRGFRQLFGKSVYAFLQAERLKLAARCLQTQSSPVAHIALDLGFSSPQHFSRAFRQQFGTPPASYRHLSCLERQRLIPIV